MSQQVARRRYVVLRGAFVVVLACAACSGRTDQDANGTSGGGAGQSAVGGAALGGHASLAGGASGGSATSSAGTGADDAEQARAIYARFLEQWLVGRSQREPGEPIPPPGADAPCFDCVTSRGLSRCAYPAGSDCGPYTACIERHCLDTESYPSSLYDCVESCLPLSDVSCHAQWLSYVNCSVPACAAACD